jgi:8-oxo-dGTP pyrophosphatase MutT (NUDIX family)
MIFLPFHLFISTLFFPYDIPIPGDNLPFHLFIFTLFFPYDIPIPGDCLPFHENHVKIKR